MSESVSLVAMLCPRCQTPIPANADEVVWVCASCGQGVLLVETGLKAIPIHYAQGIAPGAAGRPFWATDALVNILNRATYRGDQGVQAREYWQSQRRFYIPAWNQPHQKIIEMGSSLLASPPTVVEGGSAVSIPPVTLPPGDVRLIIEFIVMAVEAGRKDMVREMKFECKLTQPELWVLP